MLFINPSVHQEGAGWSKEYQSEGRAGQHTPLDVGPDMGQPVCPSVLSTAVTVAKLDEANPRPGSKSLSFHTEKKELQAGLCLYLQYPFV